MVIAIVMTVLMAVLKVVLMLVLLVILLYCHCISVGNMMCSVSDCPVAVSRQ